jgi:hypothetical protein
MGGGSSAPPATPDWETQYRAGAETELEFAPQMAQQEFESRLKYAPQYTKLAAALYKDLAPKVAKVNLKALKKVDPEGIALRKALFSEVSDELARGYDLDPRMREDATATIRGAQAARGNVLGNAPVSAEALYVGDVAQRMRQQRLSNASGFLAGWKPEDSFGSLLGAGAGPTAAVIAGNTGPGYQYVDSGAGWKGVSAGQNQYSQQLSAYGMTEGESNPWMGAAGGAASGAAMGTMIAPGWGTLIGAVAGGAIGYAGAA